ncbi:MAG TPA: HEAT repeat domain-containing protein, partial [Gemmatimonadales bacterium]|nr:HEAT repeat domain-containing protein [Gemmatimonadales bacterium]
QMRPFVLFALFVPFVLFAGGAEGQGLADRARVRDGKVRLSYATRPDVCGNGRNITISRSTDDWISDCEHGPARVVLEWRGGALAGARTYVGGRWREGAAGVTDLGDVPPAEAADLLLDLAEQAPGNVGEDLVFPATLADGVETWPRLAGMARNRSLPEGTRKSAIFWLGQAAGDKAVGPLGDLAREESGDVDVQEHAVFALSQLRDGGGVDALMDIARGHQSPKVRKSAMFWLAQSKDPRAIALFEEILRGR